MIDSLLELWIRKDLIKYFVRTHLKLIYANKLLGYLWTLFDPLMMMLVYILLVVVIFKRGGPQFPILLFSALLAWRWFTFSVASSVNSITSKAALVQTVRFPTAVLPISRVLVGLVNYLLGLFVLFPLLFIFDASITIHVLWMPVLIFIQFLFTLGIALLFAMLGVYFRDLENILQFGLRMWFYLSPALYSAAEAIPEHFLPIYMLNPFAALFESYKNVLVRGIHPSEYILITLFLAVGVAFFGFYFFTLKEGQFAKQV